MIAAYISSDWFEPGLVATAGHYTQIHRAMVIKLLCTT